MSMFRGRFTLAHVLSARVLLNGARRAVYYCPPGNARRSARKDRKRSEVFRVFATVQTNFNPTVYASHPDRLTPAEAR